MSADQIQAQVDKLGLQIDPSLPADGRLVENLAQFGNPKYFTMPSPLQTDMTCDFSFTGVQRIATGKFYEPYDKELGIY